MERDGKTAKCGKMDGYALKEFHWLLVPSWSLNSPKRWEIPPCRCQKESFGD